MTKFQEIALKFINDPKESTYLPVYQWLKPRLTNYILGLCGDVELTNDVVAESLVTIWQKHSMYNGKWAFSTWCYTLTRNHMVYHLKLIKTRRSNSLEKMSEEWGFDVEDTSDLEFESKQQELYEMTVKLINELPDTFREVIKMRELENYTYEEIVQETGLCMATVKSKIHQGRAWINKRINPEEILY